MMRGGEVMSNTYWQDRMSAAQDKLTKKNQKQIEKQMKKYYQEAAERCINDFEATYNKILTAVENGREPTPADLYKLDKYWEGQAQLKKELRKLGDRKIQLLSKQFELNWFDIYYSINLPNRQEAYNTIDTSIVQQLINQIWCADGKSWSARVWEDTERLAETLNEQLLHCVISGKKSSELKKLLQERFNVSYSNADMIARTELAHIQTQAAQQRYKDYGVQFVEVWADEDERRCDVCGKLHQKRYPIGAQMPIPAHPRCRCCIVPVVE